MENIVAQLLHDFENGKMSRRQLIQALAMVATATSAAPLAGSPAIAEGGFKTLELDHISYQVANYKRSRDFYTDLMGMTVSNDDGSHECQLHFGNSMLIVRNRPAGASGARVDHIAYRISDWNTDKVKAELERRRLKVRLDTGGNAGLQNYASFHVQDPDGFDLQISGVVKPGDTLYKKP